MEPSASSIRAHYHIEDAIEHVYDVTILGKTILTTVTKHPQAVTEWINAVKRDDDNTDLRYVGFELELYKGDNINTTHHNEFLASSLTNSSNPRLGTAQFCVGNRCLVIQLLHTMSPCPDSLFEFLDDENNAFVGIDIKSKLELLRQHFSVEVAVMCIDVRRTAAAQYNWPELREAEQSVLCLTALGVEVKKPFVDHAHWIRPCKLSDVQVQYACIGAFLNLQIGRWVDRDLFSVSVYE